MLRRARDWQELRASRQRVGKGDPPLERSALYKLVSGRVRATLETRRRIANYQTQHDDGYDGWKACRAALVLMGACCRERRVPLLVGD